MLRVTCKSSCRSIWGSACRCRMVVVVAVVLLLLLLLLLNMMIQGGPENGALKGMLAAGMLGRKAGKVLLLLLLLRITHHVHASHRVSMCMAAARAKTPRRYPPPLFKTQFLFHLLP